MSLYDYHESMDVKGGYYGIIMAAMRKADSTNLELLKMIYPHIWDELQKRYNAPGGRLESDN